MFRALIFIGIVSIGYFMALKKGPLYGLLAYAIVYFIPPIPNINWWAEYIPFSRWSLLSSLILIISFFFHRDKLITREFRSVIWLFAFTLLSVMISLTVAVDHANALEYSYKLITYCITIWFIVMVLRTQEEFRSFLMYIIVLAGILSITAYLEGERINARLEHIGANDAFESNEFSLLLGGVIPLMLPFLFNGGKSERIICGLLLPFILNALILCNSRGAIVSISAAFVYATFVIADGVLRKKIIIAAICIFPLFISLTDPEFATRMSSLWTTKKASEDSQTLNHLSSGRTGIWKYGMLMVNDYPLGAGPNNFKPLARFYLPPEMLTFHPGADYGVRAAHNSYLQILVEQGYFGLFIWIMLCLHTLVILKKGANKLYARGMSGSFMGLTMYGLTVSFVCTLTGSLFASRVYYEFFWWQVALSVVAYSFVLDMDQNSSLENREILEDTPGIGQLNHV